MSTPRGPGQRAGLDAARVLAEARAVVREAGAAALSMRVVARRLGVAPNALYSHVRSKDELLDAVLDDVLGAVALPDDAAVAADPIAAVRAVMLDSYDLLVAHPGLVPAYLDRQGARGEHAQRLGRVTLGALGRAGLDEAPASEALRVLIVSTVGFAAFSARPAGAAPAQLPADELRRTFERSLDWLLAGITGRPRPAQQGGAGTCTAS